MVMMGVVFCVMVVDLLMIGMKLFVLLILVSSFMFFWFDVLFVLLLLVRFVVMIEMMVCVEVCGLFVSVKVLVYFGLLRFFYDFGVLLIRLVFMLNVMML